MKIETEFDTGQMVWLMHENKAQEVQILLVKTTSYADKDKIDINYELGIRENHSATSWSNAHKNDDEIFATKQKLIDSL